MTKAPKLPGEGEIAGPDDIASEGQVINREDVLKHQREVDEFRRQVANAEIDDEQ